MRRIFHCGLWLTITGCAIMQPEMRPAAVQVPGNASRFVGDTLILTVSDQSQSRSVTEEMRSALLGTMRAAFPAAVILESPDDTTHSPRRVRVTANVVQYGPSWRGYWIGHAGIDVFVHDHRRIPGDRLLALIRKSSRSSRIFAPRGPRTPGYVSRAAFDSANIAVVAFLDSLDDPAAGAVLRGSAAVSEAEYAPYLVANARSSLVGLAFIRIPDETVRRAVGQPVTLDPATTSARRWYEISGMETGTTFWDPKNLRATDGAINSGSPDDLFQRTRRTTMTDREGRFTFDGLPAGTYLVRARVEWEAPVPGDGARTIKPQRAVVASVFTINDGERKNITLSETGNAFAPGPRRDSPSD